MAPASRKPVEVPPRRALWERFVERAFGTVPDDKVVMSRLTKTARRRAALYAAGQVTLVGAGPGDPELLTLKAVRALQSADVILFDDLVSDQVLELARHKAKRMLVGKRGGRQSCRQDDINDLMIKLAKQGMHVVRLKSGDPMIFGRGGEEIERLEVEGIAVSIVPGISSGLAMAAELGVSLTHRDRAHSVRFVTGHSRAGMLPGDLDWKGIADPETTLIFYMGGRTAPLIAERLIQEGLCEGTPVVIASGVSRAEGHRVYTTLGDLKVAEAITPAGPVLIGIGDVFRRCKGHVVQSADLQFAS